MPLLLALVAPAAGAQAPSTSSGRTAAAKGEQAWPLRPVRLMVGFPPGSSLDTTVRIISPKLAEVWGQPAVIENRSGASGTIATTLTAQATPDGHTALVVTASFTINAVLRPNVGYDPLRDFIGVTQIGFPTSVIAVAPALGVKSLKELIALAHERGGGHLTTESFRIAAGIKGVHVAFKGQPEIMVEMLAGRVHFAVISLGVGLGAIRDGRLLALAMVTPKRSPVLPDVPSVSEILPKFRRDAAHMLLVPAKTPRAVVDKMSRDVARVLDMPEVKKQMAVIDFIPAPTTPEETEKILRSQLAMFDEVARAAGLK
jgi:tripartite-type tricarboxylate transporter receptor subunit TctC